MNCRRNLKSLTTTEKQDFIRAVLAMKRNGKYDKYVVWHSQAMNKATPPNDSPNHRNAAHRGPAFFPWHREFIRRFELDLQSEVPGVTLPYWNWAEDSSLADPANAAVW